MVLRRATEHAALCVRGHGLQRPSGPEQVGEVQICGFPMLLQVRAGSQEVRSPNELSEAPTSQRGHDLTHILSNHEEVVDEVLRLASELLPQLRVLRCNTHGACVQVALTHHDATQSDERCCGHCNLLCSQQSGHDDIAPSSDLAVRLDCHSVPQSVQDERLVGLGNANFPRQAAMLDGCPLGRPSAPRHTRDCEVIGLSFGNT
mmetsp:Transcript_139265/g.353105  ORF Transcript_139265/g.353105 Transcript_139265/m.353105 type:complete len:204 (+) Transcript_139265:2959-3570(+)